MSTLFMKHLCTLCDCWLCPLQQLRRMRADGCVEVSRQSVPLDQDGHQASDKCPDSGERQKATQDTTCLSEHPGDQTNNTKLGWYIFFRCQSMVHARLEPSIPKLEIGQVLMRNTSTYLSVVNKLALIGCNCRGTETWKVSTVSLHTSRGFDLCIHRVGL